MHPEIFVQSFKEELYQLPPKPFLIAKKVKIVNVDLAPGAIGLVVIIIAGSSLPFGCPVLLNQATIL